MSPDRQLPLLSGSYEILDTPSESHFDEILRLAMVALEMPVATISLLDRGQQYGLKSLGSNPLCDHAVANRSLLVVDDVTADVRFKDLALDRVRFYAGMPLVSADDRVLGTLYVTDQVPRQLAPGQREILRLLAGQVISLLELRRVGHELRIEQRAIAEREQELTSLLDSMSEGVVKQDLTSAIVHYNRAAEAILGLRADDLGRTSTDPQWKAIRADGSPFPGDQHPAMLSLTGVSSRDVEMGLHHAVTGERKWISINSRPLNMPDADRPYAALTTFRDVTEHRGVQERLAQHERLVTTGTLAAGVGHEINNPLAFMMANLALAIEELQALDSPSERLPEIITLIEQAQKGGERVKRIVRGLKSLARGEGEARPLDPLVSITNAVELAGHELRARGAVSLVLDPVPMILADEGRLTQVIVNLIVNATQAFASDDPAVNRITIRARHEDGVVIEVVDNGPGIAPEHLPRIFDPFFTTKPPGVGTGLGLSISHGIVVSMGGRLECETSPRGSTFRLSLPALQGAPAPVVVESSSTGRAMAIDDERTILNSLGRILRRDLETVVLVDDPRAALAMFERGERFDVVFCDIWMPYLTGIELYEAVRRIDPAQVRRFVFVTGDTTRPEIREFLDHVSNERLDKPFTIQSIRDIARRLTARR